MNHFLHRLPLMAKLLAITIVPLLFIGFLTINLYKEKSENVEQFKAYQARINQSINLSKLAGELQKERRFSFVYALNKSRQKEMIAQRPATDTILKKLINEHDHSLRDFTSYTYLGGLDSIRTLIDSNKFSQNQVMHFYASAIFRLNTLNETPILQNKMLGAVNDNFIAQRLLADLITYQSIVDANVFNILYTKQYVTETLFGTYGTWDVYKTYQKEFRAKANPEALKKFQSFQNSGALKIVDSYLDKLFSTFKFDSTFSYSTWGTAADNSLRELRLYQEHLAGKVQQDVNNFYNREVAAKNKTIIYLLCITAFLMLLLAYILHIINYKIKQLKKAAIRLSEGETGIQLRPLSKDAIGSLATSIYKIDVKNRELALAAQDIGNGNFNTVVTPRSEKDLLGNAVVKMKEALLNYTTDLKNAKEEFEKLADFMPQIVWTADRFGKINYYNKKWYGVTGAREEFSEQVWIQVIHPDDAGHTLSAWFRAVETGELFEREYRIKDVQQNEYRWFLGRAVPVVNANNEIIKWFGTATDIHDQKLQEVKLEELVKQRTIELKRSNDDLQQFAHVASHDLKEPLRKISTFSDRLMVEYGGVIPEIGKVYLDKLQASSKKMASMIDSILKYSVVNATEQSLETIDLNTVIHGITNDLELMILQKNADISFDRLPQIKGSPALIYQLFYNLLNNALKFSKKEVPARISITASRVASSEVVGLLDSRKFDYYYHITVQDNGIGFNQQYADQMFNVFTRLNGGNKYEGTGLGLALCKKIVHRHNGAIYANGKDDAGATFHILLPAI